MKTIILILTLALTQNVYPNGNTHECEEINHILPETQELLTERAKEKCDTQISTVFAAVEVNTEEEMDLAHKCMAKGGWEMIESDISLTKETTITFMYLCKTVSL